MNKVRFHLATGENYMKWQVRSGDSVTYYDPHEVSLRMTGCRLRNQRGTAERINAGENKTVCAWVECESVQVLPPTPARSIIDVVRYNPRKFPHWFNLALEDIDNHSFDALVTDSRLIYEA